MATGDDAPGGAGGQGPEAVHGHPCPQCAEAVEEVGAVGHSARGRAVVAHVRHVAGEVKADRPRALLDDDFPPTLPGWGAVHLPPNQQPWSHLVRVVDRL